MQFEVRCRLCGDIELLGPVVCKPCRRTLAIGAALGAILALTAAPYIPNLLFLLTQALLSR